MDFQILFDPFEKEFNLPAFFVDEGNLLGGKLKIVGDERDNLSRLGIAPDYAPESVRIIVRVKVFADVNFFVGNAVNIGLCMLSGYKNTLIDFCSRDEPDTLFIESTPPLIINVSTVKNKDTFRLKRCCPVFGFRNVGACSIRDGYEFRNAGAYVEERMELEGSFGGSIPRPRKQRQAHFEHGRVEGVERVFEGEMILRSEFHTGFEQTIESGLKNPVISFGVGVRQGGTFR